MEKLDMQSPDLVNENFEKLAALFPNCVTEGADGKAIDFDLLKQELSHAVVEGNKERYRLEWPGKREAIVTANLPTTKTLRPVREDSVDFDNTENLYIEGDNLEVLKLLQESYLGKIKMIYIDPPYNTGKDFVYKDNFSKGAQEELIESGQKDEYNQRLVANPETAGRYHSDWLSMMYPRLKLARNLLKNEGVIFISIGDHELNNLISLMNTLFGEKCHVATFIWNTDGHTDNQLEVKVNHEYIVCFKKDSGNKVLNSIIDPNTNKDSNLWKGFAENSITKNGPKNPPSEVVLKKDFPCKTETLDLKKTDVPKEFFDDVKRVKHISREITKKYNCSYPIRLDDLEVIDGKLSKDCRVFAGWANNAKLKKFIDSGFKPIEEEDGIVTFYLSENGVIYYHKERDSAKNILSVLRGFKTTEKMRSELENIDVYFTYPKPNDLLQYLCEMTLGDGEYMLDFFSGSASSADAVLNFNAKENSTAKFIQVQLNEDTPEGSLAREKGYDSITEIGKERIRRAAKKIKEDTGADIDYGFRVYRLDSSNMQDVYYKPQDYNQKNLDLFADNVKPDRTADDLLAQVMLDWGLPLSLKIEQVDVLGKQVFKVAENSLYACFDSDIDEDFAKDIAKDEPLRIVFKDSGFKNDTAKTNVKQLLKQLSPETEMKVI
jgi:adenine-specific DNA-methyltransferase